LCNLQLISPADSKKSSLFPVLIDGFEGVSAINLRNNYVRGRQLEADIGDFFIIQQIPIRKIRDKWLSFVEKKNWQEVKTNPILAILINHNGLRKKTKNDGFRKIL
jgi:hypothetical protein